MRLSPALAFRSGLLMMGGLLCFGVVLVGKDIPLLYWLLAIGAAWRCRRRFTGSSWSHGKAKFADAADLMSNGLLGQEGLILGKVAAARPSRWQALAGAGFAFAGLRNGMPAVPGRLWQGEPWRPHDTNRQIRAFSHLCSRR